MHLSLALPPASVWALTAGRAKRTVREPRMWLAHTLEVGAGSTRAGSNPTSPTHLSLALPPSSGWALTAGRAKRTVREPRMWLAHTLEMGEGSTRADSNPTSPMHLSLALPPSSGWALSAGRAKRTVREPH